MNANNVFSIISRLQALCGHPLIKRHNFAFTIDQPFAWSLINSSSVLANLPQREEEEGFDPERINSLRIKCATLRHFNRQVGSNDIGMGAINACLRTDEEVPLDAIKKAAQDRVKIERRSGKINSAAIKSRYVQLYTEMYEAAESKKRKTRALMDEVYFICNRSDDELLCGDFERMLESGMVYRDEELADFDAYDYMVESVLDKCVNPIVRAKQAAQAVLDKSYRSAAIHEASELIEQLEVLGKEVGIDWKKMDADEKRLDDEINAVVADDAQSDAELEAELDSVDLAEHIEPEPVVRKRTTIKSPERLAREAEEARVAKLDAEDKAAKAHAKAQRALKKAAAQA